VSVVTEGARVAAARGLGRWLTRIAPRSARGAVTIAIVADSKVKRLNKQFRRIDKATDVLSFPGGDAGATFLDAQQGKRPKTRFLGEIVISHGIARKQAGNLKHPLATEFRVLALHGLLHLLGYDHEVDAGKMARAEARLRRKAGLPLGLIARAS
jgi:probable rRNA maturation factor